MAKVRRNYRIVVEPRSPFLGEITEHTCQDIRDSIKRHIDNWMSVLIEWDMVCSFCDSPWEVASHDDETVKKGQPLCCEKAMDEWDAQKKRKVESCRDSM